MQRNTRRKIELGQYYRSGKYTRVQHATYILSIASELDVDYSQEDIIHKLIEHFEREVRRALLGRDVSNTELLFKILFDFDFDTEKNRETGGVYTYLCRLKPSQHQPHVNVRQQTRRRRQKRPLKKKK